MELRFWCGRGIDTTFFHLHQGYFRLWQGRVIVWLNTLFTWWLSWLNQSPWRDRRVTRKNEAPRIGCMASCPPSFHTHIHTPVHGRTATDNCALHSLHSQQIACSAEWSVKHSLLHLYCPTPHFSQPGTYLSGLASVRLSNIIMAWVYFEIPCSNGDFLPARYATVV